MSSFKLLRAADYPRMPWKNGGGSTEEITRDGGDGLEGFGWRLSIADIGQSGGFSSFAGYQRVITVLQGTGMVLTVDGTDSRELQPFDAFAFQGDSATACTLVGGAIRDFNLIYSPALYRARLQWLDAPQRLFTAARTVLVFSVADTLTVKANTSAQILGLYDCLQIETDGLVELNIDGQCCLIEISPA
ncbi:histidine utilization protein [Pseudomonas sp. M47T1]|uniref:HutD/Ves family protein n=1 Tax=Pseudomonas sp. M47T1 TaxID=1179778 RepID=UPI00026085A9|nr:HutD family protein [Pseudomonas sp. M47T1]EIK96835.1 histidine utilization protein [Pseudomonas sp. M47T1]